MRPTYRANRIPPYRSSTPQRIPAWGLAVIYLVIAGLWIWLSDRVLLFWLDDVNRLAEWQTYKGWFFVLATALLLFVERAITDRQIARAEDQLRANVDTRTSELAQARTQLQVILDHAPYMFYMRDTQGHYLGVNQAWETVMGVKRSDALGKTPYECFEADVADRFHTAFKQVQQTKQSLVEEAAITLRGRDYIFMRASFPLLDEAGNVYAVAGISADITRRVRAEEALRRAEARFRAVFETVSVGINILDPSGKHLDFNPAFCALVGYDPDQLRAMRFSDLIHPDDRAANVALFAQMQRGESDYYELEKRFICANGTLRWVRVFANALHRADGSLDMCIAVVEDITAAKDAEALREQYRAELEQQVTARTAELRQVNENLATAQRIAHVGSWRIDTATDAIEWSEESYHIFGLDPATASITLPRFWQHIYPDDLELVRVAVQRTLSDHVPLEVEHRIVRADGSTRHLQVLGSFTTSPGEPPTVLHGAMQDITARKIAEQQIIATSERLNKLFNTSPYPTAVGSVLDGTLYDLNDRFAEFFGYSREAMVGKSINDFLVWVNEADRIHVGTTLRAGQPVLDYEVQLRRRNGDIRTVLLAMYRLEFDEMPVTIGMFTDITARKQAEAEVLRLNQELEERVAQRTAHLELEIAERVRAEAEIKELNATLAKQAQHLADTNRELETFTYSVSHDLKAPLRGIDGYSRLLLEDYSDRLDDDGRYFLNTIRNASHQMGQLIDDLLAYSRLERRQLAIRPVDIVALVNNLIHHFTVDQTYPQTQLLMDIAPAEVQTDADALTIVLRNLVENALKFSAKVEQPQVTLVGRVTPTGYQLTVRDNGIGIDPQYHERIFEIFQRLHRAEDYPGTGIGLAIVRKSIQRMQGRIWLDSQPGQGASFTVEIPH